jgi:hypothetical protein
MSGQTRFRKHGRDRDDVVGPIQGAAGNPGPGAESGLTLAAGLAAPLPPLAFRRVSAVTSAAVSDTIW